MKRHEEDQLLKELLAGEEMSEFRHRSFDRGLEALRRTRRRRQVVRGVALAVCPLILALAFWILRPAPAPEVRVIAPPKPPAPTRAVAATRPAATIKRISDEELLGLFPGRSMALIGPPGHQELVFLDTPT